MKKALTVLALSGLLASCGNAQQNQQASLILKNQKK
jgi:hypothetical protein